jgi:hypothetical protein
MSPLGRRTRSFGFDERLDDLYSHWEKPIENTHP